MNLQIVGLIFDVAGIFLLGINSLAGIVSQTAAQSGSYLDGNAALAKWIIQSRIDTAAGSILLVLGFLAQVASLYGVSLPSEWLCFLLVLLALSLSSYWGIARSYATKTISAKVFEQMMSR